MSVAEKHLPAFDPPSDEPEAITLSGAVTSRRSGKYSVGSHGSNNLLDKQTQLTYRKYGLSFSALSADYLN